jgi:hypothetical protein
LAHLLDLLNSISLDHTSEEYKDWSNYMEKLNEAVETVSIQAKPVGKPGEWSVASFLEPL